MEENTLRILAVFKAIPPGRATSYGAVAAAAGLPRGARQVARLLHSLSRTEGLPWHRVLRSDGTSALRPGEGKELQEALLRDEGVEADGRGRVDFSTYGWP